MGEQDHLEAAKELRDRDILETVYAKVCVIEGRCAERGVNCPGILAAQAQQGNGITVRMSGKNIGPALKAALPWLLVILSVIFGKPIADTILPPAAQPKPAQEAPK